MIFSVDKNPNNKIKEKVVLIAEYCDGEMNSTGLYWEEIAKKLNKKFHVAIISPNVNPALNDIGCAIVNFSPRSIFFAKYLPEKLHNFLRLIYVLFRTSIKGTNVILGTNPLFLPLLIPYFKIARVKSITLLCYDLFPQNLMTEVGSILYSLLRVVLKFFNGAYKLCNNIIVVGRDMRQKVLEIGVPSAKIHYIPNWGPRISKSHLNIKEEIEGQLRVLFFGNLGRFQGIPELLEQIKNVKRKDIEFVFVGDGKYKNKIKEVAKKDSRIKYLESINMSERDQIYQSAHISFVSVRKGMKGLCVPSKAYFALANGHPILALVEENSEIDILCKEFECGWQINIDRPNSLSNILDELDEKEYLNKAKSIKNISKNLLNGEHSLTRIEDLIFSYSDI